MPATIFDILFFLLLLAQNVSTLGIAFTTPAPGATLPAGPITVSWKDAGGNPDMAELDVGTLVLIVGGNSQNNSQVLQTIGNPNTPISAGSIQGTIDPAVAQSIQNGFYLMMTSNASDGNTVINYSDRFTLLEMTGVTDGPTLEGATSQAGSVSNVPTAQYNIIQSPSSPSTVAPGSTYPTTTTTATSTAAASSAGAALDSENGGLSGSLLAGLIVGVILAAIGALSLVIWSVFFYKRIARKKREQKTQDEIRKSIFGKWDKAELPGDNRHSEQYGVQMQKLGPAQLRAEAPGWTEAVEAPGNEPVFELEGDIALWEAGSGRRSKAWDPTAM